MPSIARIILFLFLLALIFFLPVNYLKVEHWSSWPNKTLTSPSPLPSGVLPSPMSWDEVKDNMIQTLNSTNWEFISLSHSLSATRGGIFDPWATIGGDYNKLAAPSIPIIIGEIIFLWLLSCLIIHKRRF